MVNTTLSAKDIEKQTYDLIKKYIGPDLVVIVRSGAQLQKILDENQFQSGYDISRVFFATKPSKLTIQKIRKEDLGGSELQFGKYAGYMYIPGDASRSKLGNNFLEKKLGFSSTTRNFNTVKKLIEMCYE